MVSGAHDHPELQTLVDAITVLADRVTTLETVQPPPDPIPPIPPVPTGIYGPGLAADTMANTTTDQGPVTYDFIADRSGPISGIRVYFEVGTGYSGGNGGSRAVTLETKAGTVLATTIHSGLPSGNSRFALLALPATLVAGTTYVLRFVNSGSGYISCNAFYVWDADPNVIQPRFPWTVSRSGVVRDRYLPVMQIEWTDGIKTGIGYSGTSQVGTDNQSPILGANKVRERFTPVAPVTFSEVWVRLKRDSGGDGTALTVKIAGKTGTIPAASFPVGQPVDAPGNHNGWGKVNLGLTTLPAGLEQTVELSAAGQSYRAQFISKGDSYGLNANFKDGKAERTTGSTWTNPVAYGAASGGLDLQFYLK